MKTFDDLVFEPHKLEVISQAILAFDYGYSISVIKRQPGASNIIYSNGTDTYELVVIKDGKICYNVPTLEDGIFLFVNKERINEILETLQTLLNEIKSYIPVVFDDITY